MPGRTYLHKARGTSRWGGAFSLVELLVVLAVIATIMGITFPMLASARRAARATTCLANMRSLAQLTIVYIEAHRRFPLSEQLTWLERGTSTMPTLLDAWTPGQALPGHHICPADRAVRAPGQASYRYAPASYLTPLWQDWLYTPTRDDEGVYSPTALVQIYTNDPDQYLWIERRAFHRPGAIDGWADEATIAGKINQTHVSKIDGSAFVYLKRAPG